MRRVIERYRQGWIDRTVGRLSKSSTWAAEEVIKIAKDGQSENARLRALQAIFTNMISVSKHSALITRVGEMEEKLDEIDRRVARED